MTTELDASEEDQKRACQAEAAALIESAGEIPEGMKSELLQHLDRFVEKRQVRSATPHVRPGGLGASYWAVRDEALDLMKNLSASAAAIAAFFLVGSSNPWILATTLVLAALDLAARLRKKQVDLQQDDFRVLMALKQGGPMTLDTLVIALNYLNIAGPAAMSVERIQTILTQLNAPLAHDGSVQALVVQAADGRWSANGV